MQNILITGATGNVGKEVLQSVSETNIHAIAGVRNINRAKEKLSANEYRWFDFDSPSSYPQALKGIDILFLLRPPQITDIKGCFVPILEAAKEQNVKWVIFLSVQGAETSKFIPHHKIEKAILEAGLNYTFLRPGYFMQNFTSTLKDEICNNGRVFLPAGKARFNLVDVADIGDFTTQIITSPDKYQNKAFVLTNEEQLSFHEMVAQFNKWTGTQIRYVSPNLLRFWRVQKKKGMKTGMVMVMIMLHYLPRLQKTKPVTNDLAKILGKKPLSFRDFVKRECISMVDHSN